MNRKPNQTDSQIRGSELIAKIYDELTKLIEAGQSGHNRVRIKRIYLRDILSLDEGDLPEDIINRKNDGIEILNGLLIPKVPPSIPIYVPSVEEDKHIPEFPGFIIDKV